MQKTVAALRNPLKLKISLIILGLIFSLFSIVQVPVAKASSQLILYIESLSFDETSIKITYLSDNSCLIGEPILQLTNNENYIISKSYPPKSFDAAITAMLIQEEDSNCEKKPIKSVKATITFPNELKLTNISPFKYSYVNQIDENLGETSSTREIRFVGIVFVENSTESREDDFLLQEYWYQPGKEPIIRVLGDKNINAILGTTKDGLILKTFRIKSKEYEILTWLVTAKKWELLSSKNIYVEPATISKDKKWLIGRQVADGPSTRIYAQNLASGAISVLFSSAKNGGGFVCGVMADDDQKYGYFSQIAPKKTTLYRIDLQTRKVKAMGKVYSGFCLSDVMEDGRVVGVVRNSKKEATQTILASTLIPDNATSRKTPTIPSAGDGSSHAFATDSLVVIQDTQNLNLYITDHRKIDLWEGPIKLPDYVQYINPLPINWRTLNNRATQPN